VTTLKDLLEIKVVLKTPFPSPMEKARVLGFMDLKEAVQNFGLQLGDLPGCITVEGGEWIQLINPNGVRGYQLYLDEQYNENA